MWSFYDALESLASDSKIVKDYAVGTRWTYVLLEDGGMGIAPTITEKWRRFDFSISHEPGMSVSDFAAGIRSWNYHESALALAAINAELCRDENIPEGAVTYPGGRRSRGVFFKCCEELTPDRRTLMIEPYYDREELSKASGLIDVIRLDTGYRDYMFMAQDELIPLCDQVLLSGQSIVDKLAGTVISKSSAAGKPIMCWGPDIPLTPMLEKFGVTESTSFIVEDTEKCMWLVKRDASRDELVRCGHFVTVKMRP